MAKKQAKCRVHGTGLIDPCFGLDQVIENDSPQRRVRMLTFLDSASHKPRKQYVAVYSGQHRKRGVVFNCCPFCGVDLQTSNTKKN